MLMGGAAAVAVAALALWVTDASRIGGMHVKFAVPALLTALIISFDVLLAARLMFLSAADSALVLDILIFSVLVAVTLSSSIAGSIAGTIRRVETGARRLASGEYSVRLPVHELGGATELAQLGRWFNQMAASVEDAFDRRRKAEQERRQIVAAVSHDLRTPLASIRALIEAITDGVVTDPAIVARYQRTIHSEVLHLSGLIDDLFELARLEAHPPADLGLQREPMALDDLISDTLEAMHGQASRRGIQLSGHVEGDLPPVVVDVRQIHRVLANLVQNALQHTPSGGWVTLRAQVPCDADRHSQVLVQVLDSGEGIAACDLPHVFEPMYRGESSRRRDAAREGARGQGVDRGVPATRGAGLGLTIARGLVEAHGGVIWAESPLAPATAALLHPDEDTGTGAAPAGSGTCISFTLPLVAWEPTSLASR
jgi:signal transduction histidine kinase